MLLLSPAVRQVVTTSLHPLHPYGPQAHCCKHGRTKWNRMAGNPGQIPRRNCILDHSWDAYGAQRLKEPMGREVRISSMETEGVENEDPTCPVGAGVMS